LGCSIGQIQAHSEGLRLQIVVEANHAFHLVVDFTPVLRDGQGAFFVQASGRLDEDDGFSRRFVPEFNRMFGEGPNGAPHGHKERRAPNPHQGHDAEE